MASGLQDELQLFDRDGPRPEPAAQAPDRRAPLAERMRPSSFEEILGQDGLVGESGLLRRAVAAGRVPSMILWGPPGTGKTTLARLVAREAHCHFLPFSAVTSGIKEIKQVMADAERLRKSASVLLFVDEIHRFNRAQQDAFLPYVETGSVTLVGATTENPSFELNSALLSRCRVLVLEPLTADALRVLVDRALNDRERGLGASPVTVSAEVRDAIVRLASGDARRALGLLEVVVTDAESVAEQAVELETVRRAAQRRTLLYDKSGEEHFNQISALHKSMRESDPDAAAYWLLRMLGGGEDAGYLARRMVRFASEDVGLADPGALRQALDAWDAYNRLGSPEGDLALVQAAIYLALAPKSTALYRAHAEVTKALEESPSEPVPLALRNAPTRTMKELGYGQDYVYAPETETGVGGLRCLPESLDGVRFYRPGDRGFERELDRRLAELRSLRRQVQQRRE